MKLTFIGLFALCLHFLAFTAKCQTQPLPIEAAVGARAFSAGSPISFSPDGRWLAYTVIRGRSETTETDGKVPWFARNADVFVVNISKGTEEAISEGQHNNWAPVWSPAGGFLAFLSDRDGSGAPKLWMWNQQTRALRRLCDEAANTGPLQWSPDGQRILFSAVAAQSKDTVLPHGVRESSERARQARIRIYESHDDSMTSSGKQEAEPWSLDEYSTSLVLVDFRSGQPRTVLRGRIADYKLSPDGTQIAFTTAKRFEAPGSQQILFDLSVLDLTQGKRHLIVSEVPLRPDGSGFSWSPDSKRLCLRVDNQGVSTILVAKVGVEGLVKLSVPSVKSDRRGISLWDESGQKLYFICDGRLWRGDLERGTTEQVAQVAGREITGILPRVQDTLWNLDRNRTLVVTHDNRGKQDGIYGINLNTGEGIKLLEQGQCYTCALGERTLAISSDGQRVAFIAEDARHPPEMWIADSRIGDLRQLTHLHPQFDPQVLGKARLIDWLSDDGERLKGALLLPSGYREGERYPLVVYVYGGSFLSNRFDRFGLAGPGPFNMQLLATRGYAVLLPDAPQHIGTPMLDLAKTVLPGVNKTIELGIADPTRLAVVGHSYGGYSVLSLIVQTTRFKAATVIAGDGDLLALYGEMRDDGAAYGVALTERSQGAMGGTPWDHRDRFIENSPFFYYDRIQTPVLIIQGTDDSTTAPFLADQTFVALRRLGKEVEYAKYIGEGHSPAQEWNYQSQVDFCHRFIQFLNTHLKPDSASQNGHSVQ